MRKTTLLFLVIFLSTRAANATPNNYMVENTSGTSPSGQVCYDFQTRPTCSSYIPSLSTASFPSGSTQYIQNTSSPSTNTQVFSVLNGKVTNTFSIGVATSNPQTTGFLANETPNPYVAYVITSTTAVQDFKGYSDYNTIIATNGATYQGINIRAATAGTANFGSIGGLTATPGHYSSGTMSAMYGVFLSGIEKGGVLSNYYAIYEDVPQVLGGSITNAYGLYILDVTVAQNNYGIYKLGNSSNLIQGRTTLDNSVFISTLVPTNVVGSTGSFTVPAGDVGEIILSSTPYATPVSFASTNNVFVATATLTTGCWEVYGTFALKATNAGTSVTALASFLTVSAGTAPSSTCINNQCATGEIYMLDTIAATIPGTITPLPLNPPTVSICVSAPTIFYMGGTATFTSTAGAIGGIRAVRFK